MRAFPDSRWRLGLAGVVLTIAQGCTAADPAVDSKDVVFCEVPHAAQSVCSEHVEPLDDTMRLSLIVKCREGGGRVVAACPTERLVGVCTVPHDTKLAWTMNRVTRVHYYLHPDVRTPEAEVAMASRCAQWTPAPSEPSR